MLNSRRQNLDPVDKQATTHAGLWMDKYLLGQLEKEKKESVPTGEKTPVQTLIEQVAGIGEPGAYQAFFQRWQTALSSRIQPPDVLCTAEATVQGRMVVGLGAEAVLENSIALHRTYGVPVIPGSALKGLASSYAHLRLGNEWKKGGTAHQVLFGDTTSAGYVTFFDALYVPRSGFQGKPLWPDVMTVHHPKYYQDSSASPPPPADWDSPTPISFLSATGRYLIALAGPEAWVDAAFEILGQALEHEGIGAKTSSGYGRMKME